MTDTASEKHPDIIVQSEQPLNLEPPPRLLRQSFVTPNELFYVRNHGSLPRVDPDGYRLKISGLVERPLELSLEEIENGFPRETLMVALHCAGNRREGLMEVAPIPGEVPWGPGAIGNARWTGALLRDVLLTAGLNEEARHVAFTGLDEAEEEGETVNFGGSIPLDKGMGPDVLLAYEMNGEPLAPEHGFPLRVIVGGYIGVRSVKWLSEVTVQDAPSTNYYQRGSYKLFPPYVTEETTGSSEGMMLGEISVNCAILSPQEDETLTAGSVLVRGYAIAGGKRTIERVDVSTDGRETWLGARLLEEGSDYPWTWCFWETELELEPGRCQIVARALDSASDTQPENPKGIWNLKGYVNNSWHRVRVNVRR